jgi:hypothetical protein
MLKKISFFLCICLAVSQLYPRGISAQELNSSLATPHNGQYQLVVSKNEKVYVIDTTNGTVWLAEKECSWNNKCSFSGWEELPALPNSR